MVNYHQSKVFRLSIINRRGVTAISDDEPQSKTLIDSHLMSSNMHTMHTILPKFGQLTPKLNHLIEPYTSTIRKILHLWQPSGVPTEYYVDIDVLEDVLLDRV